VPEVLVAVGALVVMEPLTALVHRLVMHRFGMGWHRSHHLPPAGSLEANDLFPVTFAALAIVVLCIGIFAPSPTWLVALGVGVTAYGAAYLFVHDVVIHRRIPSLPLPAPFLGRLREAHNVHHLFSRAPYGFLCPVVPRALREQAARAGADHTARTWRAPSH